jgi:hypothetical protein
MLYAVWLAFYDWVYDNILHLNGIGVLAYDSPCESLVMKVKKRIFLWQSWFLVLYIKKLLIIFYQFLKFEDMTLNIELGELNVRRVTF